MFNRLMRSLVIDAILETREPAKADESGSDFLADLRTANIETHKAPGKGKHLIAKGQNQEGIALSVDDNIVHLLVHRNS